MTAKRKMYSVLFHLKSIRDELLYEELSRAQKSMKKSFDSLTYLLLKFAFYFVNVCCLVWGTNRIPRRFTTIKNWLKIRTLLSQIRSKWGLDKTSQLDICSERVFHYRTRFGFPRLYKRPERITEIVLVHFHGQKLDSSLKTSDSQHLSYEVPWKHLGIGVLDLAF